MDIIISEIKRRYISKIPTINQYLLKQVTLSQVTICILYNYKIENRKKEKNDKKIVE